MFFNQKILNFFIVFLFLITLAPQNRSLFGQDITNQFSKEELQKMIKQLERKGKKGKVRKNCSVKKWRKKYSEKQLKNIFLRLRDKRHLTVEEKKLLHYAYLATDEDPYSRMTTLEETEELQGLRTETLCGIGVMILKDRKNRGFIIPQPGSPAEKVRIKRYWEVISIDGKSVKNLDAWQMGRLVEGPKGKPVHFVFKYENKEIKKQVVRQKVIFPALGFKFVQGIPHIWIPDFSSPKLGQKIKEIAVFLKKEGYKSCVIDLRDNPGGSTRNLAQAMKYFLPARKCSIFTAEEVKIPSFVEQYFFSASYSKEVVGENLFQGIKLIVLVNKLSASSAEIMAAALQYYCGATIVGSRTYGKGSVQARHLFHGHYLLHTVAMWKTAAGKSIENIGIKPKIIVDNRKGGDRQIEKAILLAKKR